MHDSHLSSARGVIVKRVHASFEWHGGQGAVHRLLPHQSEGGCGAWVGHGGVEGGGGGHRGHAEAHGRLTGAAPLRPGPLGPWWRGLGRAAQRGLSLHAICVQIVVTQLHSGVPIRGWKRKKNLKLVFVEWSMKDTFMLTSCQIAYCKHISLVFVKASIIVYSKDIDMVLVVTWFKALIKLLFLVCGFILKHQGGTKYNDILWCNIMNLPSKLCLHHLNIWLSIFKHTICMFLLHC